MEIIEQLCKEYTDLTDEEIVTIRGLSAVLKSLANLEDADIFIDCPAPDGDAIVVAEAKPDSVPSSYKKTVVGLLAKQENEPAVARTFRLGIATKQMKAVTQERTHVIQTVEPIKNGDRVIGVLIREKRGEDDRALGERIHFTEQSYERIVTAISHMAGGENTWLTECIDEALLLIDANGIVTFRNSLARDLYVRLGFVEDVLGKAYDHVRLVGSEPHGEDEEGYSSIEVNIGQHALVIKRVQVDYGDVAFAVIIRDITFLREQEKQLILKSVAIKEMHHRVKNNLQTIASLLRLQIRRTDNAETQQVLGESMNRILSIASTHELLARSGVDQVMIGEVIDNIKSNVTRYFARPYFAVESTVEGDDFKVDSDIATSVALIINELLQNSFKYAFPDRDNGKIRICVTKGDLYSRIDVSDDGCGFDISGDHSDRLGLSIVQTLVKDKLRGTLSLHSDATGTRASFDFKNQIMEPPGAI